MCNELTERIFEAILASTLRVWVYTSNLFLEGVFEMFPVRRPKKKDVSMFALFEVQKNDES